jgi:ribosomal 50S subunit-recycling heat shock protein
MKLIFDNLKEDIKIGDTIKITIDNQVKEYSIDKIENNNILTTNGKSGYTSIHLKQLYRKV